MIIEKWLSLDEIAKYLQVRRESIYRWLVSKKMPGHKVGRHWRFKRSEIDKWVRSGKASDDIRREKYWE